MIRARLGRLLDREAAVYAACAASFLINLFFIFVWAPHPWGHEGFDHYHQLALTLAAGGQYPTMDVPWGYAYFLALFYRTFGDHPVIPLVAQAVLNASLPMLVFLCARRWFDRRSAIAAALFTGIFSFNTVYASTQSSDAVCTILFMCALVAFGRALATRTWGWWALTGVLLGIVPQFRPNLILVPPVLAAYVLATSRDRKAIASATTLLACSALALMPWTIRNYRLTQRVLPTSIHSGIQLWYGTLQVGPYLNSRAYNPRAIFERAVFDYTSLDDLPLIVTAEARACGVGRLVTASLVYWTDRDATAREARPRIDGTTLTFEMPAAGSPSVVYYYFTTTFDMRDDRLSQSTPREGARAPFLFFVSQNHLGDLDIRGDFMDSFDLIRLMRHIAWNEPLPYAERLADAGIDDRGLEDAADTLRQHWAVEPSEHDHEPLVSSFTFTDRGARLALQDGSVIAVPRIWKERITDIDFTGRQATALMFTHVPFALVTRPAVPRGSVEEQCAHLENVEVNAVFYRLEPHLMRRYLALAMDNIERSPRAFAVATAYRALRLFVIRGSDDRQTSQQFGGSRYVYALGTAASSAYALLFVVGLALAWHRGDAVGLPLLLILYVPATIAPMLTNMRYSVTMQPLMFMFIAVAITTTLERGRPERRPATRDHAST